jgi:hypothetical protein
MTRSASSVVNVIWTVPTTDTAVLKMSGRELVYAYMQQRLAEVGGNDEFGSYVYQQFNPGFNANPVFLMDYRKVFGQNFVSGDMNYFGFREFEIKWNYLSVEYSTIGHILQHIDKKTLAEAKKSCSDKTVIKYLDDAMRATTPAIQQTTTSITNPRGQKFAFDRYVGSGESYESASSKPSDLYRQSIRNVNFKKPSKNKKIGITAAINDVAFDNAMSRYGLTKKDLKDASKIITLIRNAKDKDAYLMGGFVSEINSVVASAYRENEHLYDCQILKPIDITVLPGMVIESDSESFKAKSPRLKGYVTSVLHSIDFNAATMKTNMNISRAASDDSGIIADLSESRRVEVTSFTAGKR